MEEFMKCGNIGFKFIKELLEFVSQRKSPEEIMHFVNVNFEYSFGSTAILFIYKKYNSEEKVEISRGLSHEFVKKLNDVPPVEILSELSVSKGGIYINFKKEPEKYANYASLFEHQGVSDFYASELRTAYTDSYFVFIYSVPGFVRDCGMDIKDVFDTIFSVLAYVVNSNKCIQTLRDCSQVDYVSGLNNFKYFHEKFFQEMQKALHENGILSVALISINQLNKLNSLHGHSAGDKNIGIAANIIKKHIRAFDTAARYGNKYVILFPSLEKTSAFETVKNIFSEIESEFKKGSQEILSLNAGISTFPADGSSERVILDMAEGRRIEAKRKGRWVIFN